jgi:16S rRNA (cytosine967-C5)-methyltransferase
MRLPPAILGNAEEVLREILRFMSPADVTLSRYFKDHPRLGGRERGAIAECIYSVLRNKTFYTDFGGGGPAPARPCAAWSCWAWPKPSAWKRWAA